MLLHFHPPLHGQTDILHVADATLHVFFACDMLLRDMLSFVMCCYGVISLSITVVILLATVMRVACFIVRNK